MAGAFHAAGLAGAFAAVKRDRATAATNLLESEPSLFNRAHEIPPTRHAHRSIIVSACAAEPEFADVFSSGTEGYAPIRIPR